MASAAAIEMPGIERAGHFATEAQQEHAGKLGMWAWLITELLLFAGLFLIALVLRLQYPDSVSAVAQRLKLWIGALNTVILIVSSLAMTGAIEFSKMGRARDAARMLLLTGALGVAFLACKSFEYYQDYTEHMMPFLNRPYALAGDNASQLFVDLYYVATGLHAVHLTIGIGLVWFMARAVSLPGYLRRRQNRVEIVGLYWHFIDLIWLIAFPTLYLVNR